MRLFAFPTRRAASSYLAAERALSTRESRRNNVAIDGGFEILRDTQVPVIDAAARMERAARVGGGL